MTVPLSDEVKAELRGWCEVRGGWPWKQILWLLDELDTLRNELEAEREGTTMTASHDVSCVWRAQEWNQQ